jgi:hypothetical protein
MWKAIIVVLFILYVVYLFMALGQAFNLIKFTNRKVTVFRMLIPFYYWFAPFDESKKN